MHCFPHKINVLITHFKISRFLEIQISRVGSKLYGMVAVGFWNLCIKLSAFAAIKECLEYLLLLFLSQVLRNSNALKSSH